MWLGRPVTEHWELACAPRSRREARSGACPIRLIATTGTLI